MNYEPNLIQWKRGDIVIHDADAKDSRMLMRVVGYLRNGLCRTVYVNKERQRGWGYERVSRLINRVAVLHDPVRFSIEIPASSGSGGEERK